MLDIHSPEFAPKAAVPSVLGGLVLEKLGSESAVVVELDCSGTKQQVQFASQSLVLPLAVVASAVGEQAAVDLQRIGQISFQFL